MANGTNARNQNMLRRMGYRKAGMTRKEWLQKAGLVVAGTGAAAMGLGGAARAVDPPVGPGEPNPDPTNIISDNNGGWIVYPTGVETDAEYPDMLANPFDPRTFMTRDSRNVQWAVANVDESVAMPQVLLKAVNKSNQAMYFNFKKDDAPLNPIYLVNDPTYPNYPDEPHLPNVFAGSVKIFNNISIVGEESTPFTNPFPGGEMPDFVPDRTMIYGGYVPLGSKVPDPPPDPPFPKEDAPIIAIRNIYFAYPSNSACRVNYTNGLEVSDCVIYDAFASDVHYVKVTLEPLPFPSFLKTFWVPFRLIIGIEATALFDGAYPDISPNPFLNGEFKITNNYIKRQAEQNPADYCWVDCGIVAHWCNMDITISGNEIRNFPYVSAGVDANTGSAVISQNTFVNCGFGGGLNPGVFDFHPYGIPYVQDFSEIQPYDSAGVGVRRNDSPVLMESNLIECGYDDGFIPLTRKNRKTEFGIMIAGSTNATVKSNTVTGILEGNVAGVAHSGIGLIPFDENLDGIPNIRYSMDNHVLGNDLTGLLSEDTQLRLDLYCDYNECKNNDWGALVGHYEPDMTDPICQADPADPNCPQIWIPPSTGALIWSSGNTFVNENFWGDYPGIYSPDLLPCMLFANTYDSEGHLIAKPEDNTVSALKNGQALQGFDLCNQIFFDPGTEPPANTINGYTKCDAVPQSVKDAMAAKQSAFIEREMARCEKCNGYWDEFTQRCRRIVYPDDIL